MGHIRCARAGHPARGARHIRYSSPSSTTTTDGPSSEAALPEMAHTQWHRNAPVARPMRNHWTQGNLKTDQSMCQFPRPIRREFKEDFSSKGGQSIPSCAEVPGNDMQSNVPMASQARLQQFKRNRNRKLTTGANRTWYERPQRKTTPSGA